MGIRKELIDKEKEMEIEEEGLIIGSVRREKERWRIIIGVYVSRNIEEVLRKLEKWMERKEEKYRVIIGDFNARTEREGGRLGELEEKYRRSEEK